MITSRTAILAASLLALAGCGDQPQARSTGAAETAAHNNAAMQADAAFDKEMGTPKPAPVAAKPKPKPAEAKPAAVAAEPTATVEQGRPDWASRLPEEPGKYFAVGGAPKGKRETARVNARKELAQQLRVRVQATTTIDEGEITKIGPGGERVGRAWSNFRSEAKLSVDKELDFTRIVAEAEDAKECYALAELDRTAWAAKLNQEIAAVDAKLTAERDRMDKAGSGLRPAAQALRAVGPLAARRDALIADLVLADPQAKPPACPVDIQALFQACARNLAAISLRVEGAEDAVFLSRVQDAMARVGLTVTEKDSSVVIRLALRQTPRALPNGWTKIAVAGSATVVDPTTGSIAGSLQIDESGTDPDAGQAKAKMLDKASAALAREIDARLIDLLANSAAAK